MRAWPIISARTRMSTYAPSHLCLLPAMILAPCCIHRNERQLQTLERARGRLLEIATDLARLQVNLGMRDIEPRCARTSNPVLLESPQIGRSNSPRV